MNLDRNSHIRIYKSLAVKKLWNTPINTIMSLSKSKRTKSRAGQGKMQNTK